MAPTYHQAVQIESTTFNLHTMPRVEMVAQLQPTAVPRPGASTRSVSMKPTAWPWWTPAAVVAAERWWRVRRSGPPSMGASAQLPAAGDAVRDLARLRQRVGTRRRASWRTRLPPPRQVTPSLSPAREAGRRRPARTRRAPRGAKLAELAELAPLLDKWRPCLPLRSPVGHAAGPSECAAGPEESPKTVKFRPKTGGPRASGRGVVQGAGALMDNGELASFPRMGKRAVWPGRGTGPRSARRAERPAPGRVRRGPAHR